MNERIKQLAEQAGEYTKSVYIPPVRSKTPGKIWEDGHIDWNDIFKEKFAELIVRECARVIDRGDGEMSSMAETIWCNVCRDDILKHFGVEE